MTPTEFKAECAKLGLFSQHDKARAFGTSRSLISLIEIGMREVPGPIVKLLH